MPLPHECPLVRENLLGSVASPPKRYKLRYLFLREFIGVRGGRDAFKQGSLFER
jgi:hypothetical protein